MMKNSSIQLLGVTIPPSRQRRATSLYTREAYLTQTIFPLSEEDQYTFISFEIADILVNIMAPSVKEVDHADTILTPAVFSIASLHLKNTVDYECFNDALLSLTVYRKLRLPCVKGAVSAAD